MPRIAGSSRPLHAREAAHRREERSPLAQAPLTATRRTNSLGSLLLLADLVLLARSKVQAEELAAFDELAAEAVVRLHVEQC